MDTRGLLWKVARTFAGLDPRVLCRVPGSQGVHITFDDGPDPEATPRILDLLAHYNAKATFFVLGQQAEKYPSILDRIRSEGHGVGHHTWAHEDPWRTPAAMLDASIARSHALTRSQLFRPPYGHLTPRLVKALHATQQVVLWDVLTGDFDRSASPAQVTARAQGTSQQGGIVVFHDTQRCLDRALPALTALLPHWQQAAALGGAIPQPIRPTLTP